MNVLSWLFHLLDCKQHLANKAIQGWGYHDDSTRFSILSPRLFDVLHVTCYLTVATAAQRRGWSCASLCDICQPDRTANTTICIIAVQSIFAVNLPFCFWEWAWEGSRWGSSWRGGAGRPSCRQECPEIGHIFRWRRWGEDLFISRYQRYLFNHVSEPCVLQILGACLCHVMSCK